MWIKVACGSARAANARQERSVASADCELQLPGSALYSQPRAEAAAPGGQLCDHSPGLTWSFAARSLMASGDRSTTLTEVP